MTAESGESGGTPTDQAIDLDAMAHSIAQRPNEKPAWGAFLVRETVLIALVPAMGYGVAYAFALGRAVQLGIPDQLISVSLSDVLRALAAIAAPVGATFVLFHAILNLIPGNLIVRRRWVVVVIGGYFYAIVFLRASQAGWVWWVVVGAGPLALFLVLVAVSAVWVAIARRGSGRTFREQWNAGKSPAAVTPSASSIFVTQFGVLPYFLIFGAFTLLLTSWAAGQGSAANQTVFYEQPNTHQVLVAMDGSSYVLESVHKHQLTGTLTVIPGTTTASLVLIPKVIGPLATPSVCKYGAC